MPGVCDIADELNFDEAACLAGGGQIEDSTGTGAEADSPDSRMIDGALYERGADNVWRPAAIEGLKSDLAGLFPIPTTSGSAQAPYYLRDPNQESQKWMTDEFGIVFDKTTGKRAPDSVQKQLSDSAGGGSGDPYAGAANARAERSMRMREVESAQDAIMARIKMAQDARLQGAQFSVTPSMAQSGYFPGLQPDSPLVRSGLAQPFSFQPQAFNPERGANLDENKIAQDLAVIRRIAGVG